MPIRQLVNIFGSKIRTWQLLSVFVYFFFHLSSCFSFSNVAQIRSMFCSCIHNSSLSLFSFVLFLLEILFELMNIQEWTNAFRWSDVLSVISDRLQVVWLFQGQQFPTCRDCSVSGIWISKELLLVQPPSLKPEQEALPLNWLLSCLGNFGSYI